MIDFIIIILICLGAVVMSLAIVETQKIFNFLKENKYATVWRNLFYLMIFFLFGYVLVVILLLLKIYLFILFLTGIIFFFGSIFVLLVVKTGLLTIKELVKNNQELIRINTLKFELEKEKKTAEAIAKLKSEFMTNISHELKTPMNGIIGMTELLIDTELNSEQIEFLTTIKNSADILLNIINDLLDFAELESGKLTLYHEEFELQNFINDVFSLTKLRAKNKGLELFYSLNSDVPILIYADQNRLRQILLNIIDNAIKFTHQGEVFMKVQMFKNKQLLFMVQDTGIGIAPEQLKLIFQPFSQVDPSSTRKFGGTGLGLVICKDLVELMGGNIWVKSELGQGSTFFFTITI